MLEDFLKFLETHIFIQRLDALEELVELRYAAPPDTYIICGVTCDVKMQENDLSESSGKRHGTMDLEDVLGECHR